jgi:hypothetical protein
MRDRAERLEIAVFAQEAAIKSFTSANEKIFLKHRRHCEHWQSQCVAIYLL